MTTPASMSELSTTAASNNPAGSDAPSTLDDQIRALAAIVRQNVTKGSDIASASAITIPASGNYFVVTGTTGITSITDTNSWYGREVVLKFSGALTITHSANLILPGAANITTVDGSVVKFVSESSGVWRCTKHSGTITASGLTMATSRLLGRTTAGTGAIEEITIGTGLSLSAGSLSFSVTGYGQCILDKSGANLVLSPCNGNLLTINGVAYEIPDAGVSLSAAAVSDGFKYIYAYMNAGTMTLEASTTARATSTTAGNKGVQIKSGDDSRTLVGAAYCQSNAWTDVFNSRLVLSWFNRRDITGRAWLTANRTVAAAGPQEINTEARVYFICWADEAVHAHANGTASNSNAFQTTDMCIGIDGVSVIGGISKQANTTANSVNSLAATTQAPAGQLTEAALHYLVLAGGASANTATYYGGADNAMRCEINFRTRG